VIAATDRLIAVTDRVIAVTDRVIAATDRVIAATDRLIAGGRSMVRNGGAVVGGHPSGAPAGDGEVRSAQRLGAAPVSARRRAFTGTF